MEIVAELTDNASTMLSGALTALREAKRQIQFSVIVNLESRIRLDEAISHIENALEAIKHRQQT
jgi:uncharacterized phage protein gp47/JayE